jgi:hypothetical protein
MSLDPGSARASPSKTDTIRQFAAEAAIAGCIACYIAHYPRPRLPSPQSFPHLTPVTFILHLTPHSHPPGPRRRRKLRQSRVLHPPSRSPRRPPRSPPRIPPHLVVPRPPRLHPRLRRLRPLPNPLPIPSPRPQHQHRPRHNLRSPPSPIFFLLHPQRRGR